MKRNARALISILLPLAFGAASAAYINLETWLSIKDGLIAFLGIIVASLMQVMPMTTNFIQSDKLTPANAARLVSSLTKQQHYWAGLLAATVTTLIIIIISTALQDKIKDINPIYKSLCYENILCFLIAAFFSFLLIKLLGLFSGIMSLHRLRGELVIDAANRAATEKQKQIQAMAGKINTPIPDGYGQIIEPPH